MIYIKKNQTEKLQRSGIQPSEKTCVSLYHGDPNEDIPETPRT